jgi:Ca2+/Na+ antiporter
MISNHTMYPSPQWMAAMAARGMSPVSKQANRVTIGGVWLFMIGLTVFFSGVAVTRLHLGNLRIQPFLIPLATALPLVLMRLPRFPMKILIGFCLFWAMYAASLIGPSIQRVTPLEDAVKLGAAVSVIITAALLVSSRADFILGTAGLAIAIGALAGRGLQEEQENIIEVANKNSYSLYALPVVLLALYIAVRVDWKRKVSFRAVAIPLTLVCSLVAALAIVAGANRSGYLGLALIVLMMGLYLAISPRIRLGRKSQGAVLLACLVVAVLALLVKKGSEVFERRYEQTVEGNTSDTLRVNLFKTAVTIGLEHPLRGVSPQRLPVMLGERLGVMEGGQGVETHNVFAHIIGGCGLIELAILIYLATGLFFWRPKGPRPPGIYDDFFDARTLLRMMLVLWAIRGSFSQEILYNPGFCVGIGLAIGLCITELEVAKKNMLSPSPLMSAAPRAQAQRGQAQGSRAQGSQSTDRK